MSGTHLGCRLSRHMNPHSAPRFSTPITTTSFQMIYMYKGSFGVQSLVAVCNEAFDSNSFLCTCNLRRYQHAFQEHQQIGAPGNMILMWSCMTLWIMVKGMYLHINCSSQWAADSFKTHVVHHQSIIMKFMPHGGSRYGADGVVIPPPSSQVRLIMLWSSNTDQLLTKLTNIHVLREIERD
jgi:hypothetical protein